MCLFYCYAFQAIDWFVIIYVNNLKNDIHIYLSAYLLLE